MCYVQAELAAAALWARWLDPDPLDPAAGAVLRQLLFESDATAGSAATLRALLGHRALCELQTPCGAGGLVPDLSAPIFQDIDLFG